MTSVLHVVLNEFKPDHRVLKQCKSLVHAKYDVSVAALAKTDGIQRETIDGVDVHRLKLITSKLSKLRLFQFIKYIEFSIILFRRFSHVSVIHCHDIGPLPIAFFAKIILRWEIFIVYDSHEYQCHRHNSTFFSSIIIYFIERLLTPRVDTFITVSDSIAKWYQTDYKIDLPEVILNTPEYRSSFKTDILRFHHNIPKDHKIFLYQGLLGSGRGIENILCAMEFLKDQPISFVFMGYGPLANIIIEQSEIFPNIYYQRSVPQTDLLNYTASADFGVNLTINTCLSRYYALPNKLFEYSMARIPCIVSDHYERANFVQQNDIGYVIEDDNIDEIVRAFNMASTQDSSSFINNLDDVCQKYNWQNESIKLLNLYSRLLEC